MPFILFSGLYQNKDNKREKLRYNSGTKASIGRMYLVLLWDKY